MASYRWMHSRKPDEINRFKTESDYADEVEIATIHRALETLRAAMNWGMAQTPPLFKKSPFHRFGVRMNKKLETTRDRRLLREEEKLLLDAALQKMNTGEHQFVGRAPARPDHRRAGALLPPRRDAAHSEQAGELGHLPNRHPRATAKDKENRRIPFNPEGRLAAILSRRRPSDRRRTSSATRLALPAEHPDRMGNTPPARSWHRAKGRPQRRRVEPRTAAANRSPLARL